jgi:ATP-binding cassette subfamily F protein 3
VLVGENGNGKTTLVKLLLGQLEATEGRVDINRQAKFALVNQHHADMIDLRLSPMQFMEQKFPGNGTVDWELKMKKHLERCGVAHEQLNVAAFALSGGQRSRLALAAVSFMEPHVLFLDEPTNNLDLSSIEALAEAVENFKGGVVLVSHDQHFVSRVAKEVWLVGNGAVTRQESFESYRAHLLAEAVPGSDVAAEAVEALMAKKLMQSGGQVSRLALAKEKAKLLKSSAPTA